MATIINDAQVQALAHRLILKEVEDQWYKESPLFSELWARRKYFTGGRLVAKANIGSNVYDVGTYDGGVSAYPAWTSTLPVVEADWNYKLYRAWYTYTDKEELSINRSVDKAVDVLVEKAKQVREALSQKVSLDMYGTGTFNNAEDGTITGLQAICDSGNPGTSYNYGNINRSTYSWWQGKKITAANSASLGYGWSSGSKIVLDESGISRVIRQASWTMKSRPKLWVCNKDVYGVMKDLFRDNWNYGMEKSDRPSLGFDDFLIEGNVRVVWDDRMDDAGLTADAFLLNLDYIWMWTYKGFDMNEGPMTDLFAGGYEGMAKRIKWGGNIGCNAPQRQTWITNIAI